MALLKMQGHLNALGATRKLHSSEHIVYFLETFIGEKNAKVGKCKGNISWKGNLRFPFHGPSFP